MSTRTNERVAWFNGEFMPEREVRIPFRDSSWVYGDGCFDMTRSFGHRLFKVKEHVDRLYRSLKNLRIDPGFGPQRMCELTQERPTGVLSALAPASIACAELKPAGGQAASKIPSTVTVLRRRSSLRRSAGTCRW